MRTGKQRTAEIGRAKTILLFGGENPTGILSSIVVQTQTHGPSSRIAGVGPGGFDNRARRHLHRVVLPIARSIVRGLGATPPGFSVSVVNVGAASGADLATSVDGYSADVPVFLAALSVALGMPIPQNLAATGHLASPAGDIRMVAGLPEKLAAAAADASVHRCVVPTIDDDSLRALSPRAHDAAVAAVHTHAERIRVTAVADVFDLVRCTFSDESILQGALAKGFFDCTWSQSPGTDAIGRAIEFLGARNEDRFWSTLERQLLEGQGRPVRRLLGARIACAIRCERYPRGLGRRLAALVQSLPPATRRTILKTTLLSMPLWVRVTRHARDEDLEDAFLLIEAVKRSRPTDSPRNRGENDETRGNEAASRSAVVDQFLEEVSAVYIAEHVTLPIDAARAAYPFGRVTVSSHDTFLDAVASFYLFLVQRVRGVSATADRSAVAADSLRLLDAAFRKQGGTDAALAEALQGVSGGLRFVLDVMTEQYKAEARTDYVNERLKRMLDPRDFAARTALVATLLERLAPHLPPELRDAPPERFARSWDTLVRAYVESLDRFQAALRSF